MTPCAYCFMVDDRVKHYKPALCDAARAHGIIVYEGSDSLHSDCWNALKALVERAKERVRHL